MRRQTIKTEQEAATSSIAVRFDSERTSSAFAVPLYRSLWTVLADGPGTLVEKQTSLLISFCPILQFNMFPIPGSDPSHAVIRGHPVPGK